MPDLPMGQPPRIAGPVTGATPIAPIVGQRGRDNEGGRQQRPRQDGEPEDAPDAVAGEPEPLPDPLVQALDRLLATSELRPVDLEVARILHAQRAYRAQPPAAEPPDEGSAG